MLENREKEIRRALAAKKAAIEAETASTNEQARSLEETLTAVNAAVALERDRIWAAVDELERGAAEERKAIDVLNGDHARVRGRIVAVRKSLEDVRTLAKKKPEVEIAAVRVDDLNRRLEEIAVEHKRASDACADRERQIMEHIEKQESMVHAVEAGIDLKAEALLAPGE